MPPKKSPVTVLKQSKPRNRGTPWDINDIFKILNNTYDILLNNPDEFYYGWLIEQQGLGHDTLRRWVNKDPDVEELYNKIRGLSERKLGAEMIKARSKLNPIATMFLLKCKYNWIERDKDRSIAVQEQVAKNEELKIKIGFTDGEDS